MNVICVICSDQLIQTDEAFYTRCGHLFHHKCLTQWLERSKSCPQCRERVTQSRIHRLYFTFSNNEIVESNATTLQERIDNLKFQITLREKDIKYHASKTITLEKQNAGLRQEVRKVESEINQKNSAIYALKDQVKYFKDQSAETDFLKSEVARLKKKIEELRPVQVLLHAPTTDVHQMIGKTRDPDSLIVYISVLKKELIGNLSKTKQLRVTIKRLQDELAKSATESDSVLEERSNRMRVEEKLAFSESRAMSLQIRVNELESILGLAEDSNNSLELLEADNSRTTEKNTRDKILRKENRKKEKSFGNSKESRHRKKKISEKNSISINEEISTSQIETISSEDSFGSPSASDCPIAAKRPKILAGRKKVGDTSNLSKSSDGKYKSRSALSKSTRKKDSIDSEIIQNYSDTGNEKGDSIIDLK